MYIWERLEKADKKIFKVCSVDPDCPLSNIIPKKKETKYQLIFKYNLWSFYYLYITYVLCIVIFLLFVYIMS